MAIDPLELMSPRERLAHNINLRARAPDGGVPPPPSAHATPAGDAFFGADGLDFEDLLDIVNPLQHLPLVSIAYREISGDEISPGARVIGGGLYGGPAGVFFGAMDAAVAEASGGKDVGAIALSAISDEAPAPNTARRAGMTELAELDAVAPAAGEIRVSSAPRPWVDPDSLPPEPAAPAPAAGTIDRQDGAPRRIIPAAPPPAPEARSAPIPELSEDQVALLLSSVGLKPQASPAPAAAPVAALSSAPAAPAVETPIKRAAAPPARETARFGLGPMKQTYIRAAADAKVAPHAPITPEMRAHMSRPSVPASSADPAWISEAMAAALDKYRNGRIMEQPGKPKGSSIDGSF